MIPHLSQCPSDQAFDHGASVIVQEMDLVNDQELDQLSEGDIPRALPSDDVPLFRSCYQHLINRQSVNFVQRNIKKKSVPGCLLDKLSNLIMLLFIIITVFTFSIKYSWKQMYLVHFLQGSIHCWNKLLKHYINILTALYFWTVNKICFINHNLKFHTCHFSSSVIFKYIHYSQTCLSGHLSIVVTCIMQPLRIAPEKTITVLKTLWIAATCQ